MTEHLFTKKTIYWFLFNSFISRIGSIVTSLILPIIIFNKTQNSTILIVAYSLQMIPFIIFGSIFNSIIVKYRKIWVFFYSDVLQILLIAIIWLYFFNSDISLIIILILLLTNSSLAMLNSIIGDYYVVPSISNKENLTMWNSLYSQIINYATLIAPLIITVSLTIVTEHNLLIVDTLSFIPIVIFSLYFIFRGIDFGVNSVKTENTKSKYSYVDGLKYLYERKDLLQLSIIALFINLGVSNLYPTILIILKESYQFSTKDISIFYFAVNVFCLLATPLMKVMEKWKIVYLSLLLSFIGVALFFIPSFYFLLLGVSISTIGIIIFNSYSIYIRQVSVDEYIKPIVIIIHKSLITIPYLVIPLYLPYIINQGLNYSYVYMSLMMLISALLLIKYFRKYKLAS